MIKKWYRRSNGKNKVLAVYYGQSTNVAKISHIVEAIKFTTNCIIKEEDIEGLNLAVTNFI